MSPYFLSCFRLYCLACGILILPQGFEPTFPMLKAWSAHWTAREVPDVTLKSRLLASKVKPPRAHVITGNNQRALSTTAPFRQGRDTAACPRPHPVHLLYWYTQLTGPSRHFSFQLITGIYRPKASGVRARTEVREASHPTCVHACSFALSSPVLYSYLAPLLLHPSPSPLRYHPSPCMPASVHL